MLDNVTGYSMVLNNYLAGAGESNNLSTDYTSKGASHSPIWHAVISCTYF